MTRHLIHIIHSPTIYAHYVKENGIAARMVWHCRASANVSAGAMPVLTPIPMLPVPTGRQQPSTATSQLPASLLPMQHSHSLVAASLLFFCCFYPLKSSSHPHTFAFLLSSSHPYHHIICFLHNITHHNSSQPPSIVILLLSFHSIFRSLKLSEATHDNAGFVFAASCLEQ